MTRNHPLNAYKETRIKTASQGQLILMLYDEALKQIDLAIKYLEQGSKQLDRVNNSAIRAQEMITELLVSLDFDKGGEIASNLFKLYMYFNQTLMEGNLKKDLNSFKQIRPMIADLRDTWASVVSKAGAVEDNASVSGVDIAG